MNEFIKKLIGRLEEEQKSYEAEHAWNYAKGLEYAVEIINELAEEYINCSTNTSTDCSTKVSEMPTGWIPCSERLPEEVACYLVAWMDERNRPIPFYEIVEFDSVDWCEGYIPQAEGNYRILAWQPLPAPYMKGE